jgi:hypothetical protein
MTFKGPPRPRQALKALGVGVDRRVGAGDDRARTRAGPRDPRADPGAELTRRRERRRVDAREHLRTAHHMFMTMGIEAFAARTAREPLATGEKAREWVPETGGQLTAQERQIARLARDGLSNHETDAARTEEIITVKRCSASARAAARGRHPRCARSSSRTKACR